MILITGFEPFGKFKNNITKEIILKINREFLGKNIETLILPVSWNRSLNIYMDMLKNINKKAKLILLLGIHESKFLRFEKFAYNWMFGLDNDFNFKIGPITRKNSFIQYTSIPINQIIQKLRQSNLKIKIRSSLFPGTYLCNFIYYWALTLSKWKQRIIFIHVPYYVDLSELHTFILQFLMVFDSNIK
ncbi:MAG: hypothetical protein GF317_16410 [Candidatus Lokiarchaeota archaeon]|nr:hypothetical protein [Candidatus Lokiarchaeota archaeon]MBD3201118.1 hypothetical protein [Candidatus Lokiarchaeota archaeon]